MQTRPTIPEFATPQHVMDAMAELKQRVGTRDVDVFCHVRGDGCAISLYPNGIANRPHLLSHSACWDAAMAEMHAKWDAYQNEHAADTVRRMALKIIEVTADRGECRDGDLRIDFSQEEINSLGERAIEAANEMAANGPFGIVKTEGANAA